MRDKRSFYEVLEVDTTSSPSEIRNAYKQKALKFHPDKKGDSLSEFLKIKEAYDVLIDPQRKFIYDTTHSMDGNQYVSLSELSNIYEKFMSFIVIASHIIKSSRKNKKNIDDIVCQNDDEHVRECKDKDNYDFQSGENEEMIDRKMDSKKNDASNVDHIEQIHINLKVPLKDVYYQRSKKVLLSTTTLNSGLKCETFVIDLFANKKCVEFLDRGDECLIDSHASTYNSSSIKRNSVIFHIEIIDDIDIQLYSLISDYDLFVEVDVCLYDYIFGKKFSIYIFEDKVKIRYDGGSPRTIMIEGKGLPYEEETLEGKKVMRGNCYVHLNLCMPLHFDRLKDVKGSNYNEVKMFKLLCKKYLT